MLNPNNEENAPPFDAFDDDDDDDDNEEDVVNLGTFEFPLVVVLKLLLLLLFNMSASNEEGGETPKSEARDENPCRCL